MVIFILLQVMLCPFLFYWYSGPVYAAPDTLDLQLDDPAVIRWDITDIVPEDSGIEPINLYNNGDIPGYLYIWISDIVDGEGLNPESETGDIAEPGELSSQLMLDIINPGMTFGKLTGTGYMQYFDLPVNMASFPGSSNQALFIIDTLINPGETLELQWQWQLPSPVANEVQGDAVSFTVNYMLSSLEPMPVFFPTEPPPAPVVPPTTLVTTTPTPEPTIPDRTYVSEDGMCVIYIPEGLHVYDDSGSELTNIVIDTPADFPPAPELHEFAGKTYRVLNFAEDGWEESTQLQQEVQLTVYFDPTGIPEGSLPYLASYHPVNGWVRLDATGGLAEGQFTAEVNYLGWVAVIYETDVRYVELIAPETIVPALPDTRETTDIKAILEQASLGVAITGTVAMTTMAIIERIRRYRLKKLGV